MNSATRGTIRRTRAENAQFVIRSVKRLGLRPNPQSRLMRMYRLLTEADQIIGPNHPEFETALEAERDLQILGFVFDQGARDCADEEFRRLIRDALKDSVLPQEDRAQSKGRDAQFELYVAAICQNAAMVPVAREEPDVTCHVGAVKYGIAAKRVKSVTNLEKRIRNAAEQVQNARLPGIIALDTSVALNRENERITIPVADEEFGLSYSRALKRWVSGFHDGIQEWVCGKGVRGVMIHDYQVRFQAGGEWSLVGMTMPVNTARQNHRRNREFSAFARQYPTGLPNVEHF